MTTLYLDLETYSEVPIRNGTYAYAEKAEIMVAAWALDDGQVQVHDFTVSPHYICCRIIGGLIDKVDQVVIHNSHFDRTVLAANGIALPPAKIIDTMVLAMQHSLPGSLGKLCEILNVPTDQAKDADGKRLINLFCKPRPKNMKLRRATRETHPDDWQRFLDYARLDIEAMRAVYKKLPRWNMEDQERALWLLDQRINDRGVAIDMDLVRAAIVAVDREQERLGERARALTDDAVRSATQRDALLRHILEAYGVPMDDLKASTIEDMLQNDNYPPELLELLRVRLQASTTSTAKYHALTRAVSADGRLRGALQFCGASRTGRWAGRLFQPQNLPRPSLKQRDIDDGVTALKADCAEELVDDVMQLTSSALRGVIVAPPGRKLVVADLSNIEGRVLAWLAGEDWKLEAFRRFDAGEGPDLYNVAYARSFRVQPESVTRDQRQIGKVQELALGYEGGVGAFVTFAAAYGIDLDAMAAAARPALGAGILADAANAWDWARKQRRTFGLERDTWTVIDGIKRAWRLAHPDTVLLWAQLGEAFRSAWAGTPRTVGRLVFDRKGAWLRVRLPSGRMLCYPQVEIDAGGKITYAGVNQYTRKWGRIGTYGGKLAENITQAVARDVLADGMLAAEGAGYQVVLSVHDELITETPDRPEFNAEALAAGMTDNPGWAEGLPLAAAGFESHRYRKG